MSRRATLSFASILRIPKGKYAKGCKVRNYSIPTIWFIVVPAVLLLLLIVLLLLLPFMLLLLLYPYLG